MKHWVLEKALFTTSGRQSTGTLLLFSRKRILSMIIEHPLGIISFIIIDWTGINSSERKSQNK